MNEIKYLDAVKYKENWHRLRPSQLADCFESYSETTLMYSRVIAFYTEDIKPLADFVRANESANVVISLHMGVDNGLICPFIELAQLKDIPTDYQSTGARLPLQSSILVGFDSHNNDWIGRAPKYPSPLHVGVSMGYLRECASAWTAVSYDEVSKMFFQNIQEVQAHDGMPATMRPVRVTRFILTDVDKEALKSMLSHNNHSYRLHVCFGLNYGHRHSNKITFTPIFSLEYNVPETTDGSPIKDSAKTDTPPPITLAHLDFLHPCPPFCGDPPGTGGGLSQ